VFGSCAAWPIGCNSGGLGEHLDSEFSRVGKHEKIRIEMKIRIRKMIRSRIMSRIRIGMDWPGISFS
jgi:hypothetical protein